MSVSERFIESATRPLAKSNAELHIAAGHELRERIDPRDETAIERATVRLDARDRNSSRKFWVPALLILMALISLPIVVSSSISYFRYRKVFAALSSFNGPETSSFFSENLSESQKLLLFGDQRLSDESARWKALWDSRPEHAPYFVEYVTHYLSQHQTLPLDFLKTAEEIDPDNGWYWAMAASFEAKDNYTKVRPKGRGHNPRMASLWTVNDPDKHAAALTLLHLAVSKPRFTGYTIELVKERIPLLPALSDYPSQIPRFAYLEGIATPIFRLRWIGEGIAAEAQRCGDNKDLNGYLKIQKDHRMLTKRILSDGNLIIDGMLGKFIASHAIRPLRDAAEKLDREGDAESYRSIDREVDPTAKQRRLKSQQQYEQDEIIDNRSSCITVGFASIGLISRQTKQPIPITVASVTPLRRAEHAFLGRAACLAIWAVLGLALAGTALFRFRHGPLLKFLSARTSTLLGPVDWAWIMIGGGFAPLLWHLLIAELSPLAAHHWNMQLSEFVHPTAQFIVTAWLMIIAPLVIARWRLGKQAGFLGMQQRHQWIGWLAIATAMLALPLVGLAFINGPPHNATVTAAAILLGISLLWWLIVVTRALFGKSTRALQRQTIARLLVPAYAVGMTFAIACVPLFHAVEKHWMAQDQLIKITVEEPSMTAYEFRVAQQLKSELLETFSHLP